MRICRTALVACTVALLCLATAGPASAGGPTSVLLVDPQSDAATSLYYTDPEYDRLAELVGAADPSGIAGEVDGSGATHETGSGITLTWLIHDVAVWRVDRVYVGAKDGPWISTQLVMNDDGNVYDAPTVWHRAADGDALVALLGTVGLKPGAGAAPAGGLGNGSVVPVDPAAQPAEAAAAASSPAASADRAAWGLGGLVVGIALTVVAGLMVLRARRQRDVGRTPAEAASADVPRPDVPQDDVPQVDVPEDAAWSTADELASVGPRR